MNQVLLFHCEGEHRHSNNVIAHKCDIDWVALMKCDIDWVALMKCDIDWVALMKCDIGCSRVYNVILCGCYRTVCMI